MCGQGTVLAQRLGVQGSGLARELGTLATGVPLDRAVCAHTRAHLPVPRTHLGQTPWHTCQGCCADRGASFTGMCGEVGGNAGSLHKQVHRGCVCSAQRAAGALGMSVQSHKGACTCV